MQTDPRILLKARLNFEPMHTRTTVAPPTPTISTPQMARPTASLHANPPWETLQLGNVACDFIHPDDFHTLLKQWLVAPVTKLHHVVTLNPEMVMGAAHDETFKEAVQRADIRVPDGAGLIWAHWYIRSQFWSLLPSLLAFPFRAVERVTGVVTVETLARLCTETNKPLYLVGGTPEHVRATAQTLTKKFPQLKVHTSSPHTYDRTGPAWLIDDIQTSNAAVVLVAYGAPRQSIWIDAHRHVLPHVRIAVGVGGAFAILSEDRPRAPLWLRKRNLEWLWRLLLEPSRLPRIWQATVRFPLLIKRQKEQTGSERATYA